MAEGYCLSCGPIPPDVDNHKCDVWQARPEWAREFDLAQAAEQAEQMREFWMKLSAEARQKNRQTWAERWDSICASIWKTEANS